ncbi:hypothetical protein J6590_099744, partial [Homalodisca vitripennis]
RGAGSQSTPPDGKGRRSPRRRMKKGVAVRGAGWKRASQSAAPDEKGRRSPRRRMEKGVAVHGAGRKARTKKGAAGRPMSDYNFPQAPK